MKDRKLFNIGLAIMALGIVLSFVDRVAVNTMGNMVFGAGFTIFLGGVFG